MTVRLSHGWAVVLMVLVALLWSTAGVVTRHLEAARAFEITFWRSLFTALALAVALTVLRGRQVWRALAHAGPVLWLSGLCWAAMFTAFMVALTLTSVANVLITLAAGPLLTACVSRWVTRQRLPPRTWWAIGAAGVGIGGMFISQLTSGGVSGMVVALAVPVAAAINWTLVQRDRLAAGVSGTPIDLVPAVLLGAVLSAALTAPLAWPFGASAHDLGLLAGLGVFQLALPCVVSVWCARVLSAPEVSLLALLEVVFGTALAWLGAGETPSADVLWGGLLVLAALTINEWLAWRERRPA